MAIKIGNLDISSFKVGGNDCSIYLGDTLLYPTVKYKYQAKYTDGSEYKLECDTATGLTSADTRVNTYTDVSAVTVGDCIITLKTNAFRGFTSLSNVSLPKSLVNINGGAFKGCTSLVSLKIPNGVTSIGNSAFYNCRSLTTVNIPSGITSIPLQCFTNCYSLTSIEIPSGVTTINSSAFQNCSGLTEVVIPSSVAGINFAAFANCSGLTSIKMESATPPTLPNPSTSFAQPFDNTNNCPIYVPAESVNTYKTATNWSEYADRIQAIPSSTPQWVTFSNGDTIPSDLQIYGIKGFVNDLSSAFDGYDDDIYVEDEAHNRYDVHIGGYYSGCYNETGIAINTSVEYIFSNIGCSDSYTVSSHTIAYMSNDIQLLIYA